MMNHYSVINDMPTRTSLVRTKKKKKELGEKNKGPPALWPLRNRRFIAFSYFCRSVVANASLSLMINLIYNHHLDLTTINQITKFKIHIMVAWPHLFILTLYEKSQILAQNSKHTAEILKTTKIISILAFLKDNLLFI